MTQHFFALKETLPQTCPFRWLEAAAAGQISHRSGFFWPFSLVLTSRSSPTDCCHLNRTVISLGEEQWHTKAVSNGVDEIAD